MMLLSPCLVCNLWSVTMEHSLVLQREKKKYNKKKRTNLLFRPQVNYNTRKQQGLYNDKLNLWTLQLNPPQTGKTI